MTTEGRLREVLGDLGGGAGDLDAAALASLVDRVVDAVGERAGALADADPFAVPMPREPGPLPPPTPDTSPWVWRDDPDPASGAAIDRPDADGTGAEGTDAGGRQLLAGSRLAVKDLISVGGRPMRCGSRTRFDAPPSPADAPAVDRLRAAGAVVVGATKLHELAFGVTGLNPIDGTPAHPVDPGRVPGGSSSGSAVAVAIGEADVALGTDTGGSVRAPASLCGVVGHKPARGAVSLEGVQALSPTLDHVGWFTPDVAGARAVAMALSVPTSDDHDGPPPNGMRLGVASDVLAAATEPVAASVRAALDRLADDGVELIEVPWPAGEEVWAATTAIMFAEAARVHRRTLAERAALLGPDVRARLVQGSALDLGTYLDARALRVELRRRCLATLAVVDAVLTPATPIVAPTLAEAADPAVAAVIIANTRLANATGLPALSLPIPAAVREGDLPVGLQLEAATDGTLLTAAARAEHLLAT
ncbi:MAG: amidase [Actinomycetota bacterium]|nr:amidase [Actinomycetota bacterium]